MVAVRGADWPGLAAALSGEMVAYIDDIERDVQLFHPATAGHRQMTRGLRVLPPLVWLP